MADISLTAAPKVALKRLKSRAQFQAVLAGQTLAKTNHFALHWVAFDGQIDGQLGQDFRRLFSPGGWLGAMAPKRWAKRAVTRNAIKRQIYTVGASLINPSPSAAYLVRLRQEFSRKSFPSASSKPLQETIRTELTALLQRGLKEN